MRSLVVLAIALLVAPMGITSAESTDRLAVTIVNFDEKAALVTWSPAPDAIAYEVYRGTSPEHATLIEVTSLTAILDGAPLPGEAWYIIKSLADRHGGGGAGGSCVDRHGTTGVSVTTSSCV